MLPPTQTDPLEAAASQMPESGEEAAQETARSITEETEAEAFTEEAPDAAEPEAGDAEAETAEEETEPEENGEASDSEAAEASSEEKTADQEARAKTTRKRLLVGAAVILLLLAVYGVTVAYNHVYRGTQVDADAAAVTMEDLEGNAVETLSNRQFSFYYWGEYYYYVNNYGFTFDAAEPLSEQTYQESTDSETGDTTVTTWEDYFMDSARASYAQTAVLKAQAEKEGFVMADEYQSEYDAVVGAMPTNAANAGFTKEDGTGDVLAYIQDSYGPDVTVEDFEEYLYTSYYVSSYSEQIRQGFTYEDSDLDAYYGENEDYFTAYGIVKSEQPNINVRHILIEPEADENGEVSDEAKAAAKEKAEQLLEDWKSGEATEESFAELANAESADGGSNTNGGLYEGVYPGQMVEAFNDWCFDEGRQSGDTDIVETDFGYHIMYFVSQTEEYYWKTIVENELRYKDYTTWLEELEGQYNVTLTKKAAVADPEAVKQIQANAAEQAAQQEAAQQAAEASAAPADDAESSAIDSTGAAG